MGFFFRKRVTRGASTLNLTGRGASVSEHVGPVTVNSRGRITLRLAKGLSWRLRK